MSVTYYVVVPFDRNEAGELTAGEAKEVPTAASAETPAAALKSNLGRAPARG